MTAFLSQQLAVKKYVVIKIWSVWTSWCGCSLEREGNAESLTDNRKNIGNFMVLYTNIGKGRCV